jgi:hypothetical protein
MTSAANESNEALLVIESPLLAAHFTREMNRLCKEAKLGITQRLGRKLQQGRKLWGSGVQRGESRVCWLGGGLLGDWRGEERRATHRQRIAA